MFLSSYLFSYWIVLWCREINSLDGSCGAHLLTLAAGAALQRVDVRQVALDGDSSERALLFTLATTDTCYSTSLLGSRTLVAVDATNIHTASLRSFLAQLDDVARTGLGTSSTSSTKLLVDLSQTGFGIDGNGSKLACFGTVATAKTSKSTSGLTGGTGVHSRTCAQSAILYRLRAVFTRTITSHHSHHGLGVSNSHT